MNVSTRFDELVDCEAVVEGVDGAEDLYLFFRSGVRTSRSMLVDFPVFVAAPLPFGFVFLRVAAVYVFGNFAFFFFFATPPKRGAVEDFFAMAVFMM